MEPQVIEEIFRQRIPDKIVSIQKNLTGFTGAAFKVETVLDTYYIKFTDSLYWLERLSAMDYPLPEIVCHGIETQHPFIIFKRIEGIDLFYVLNDLNAEELRSVAKEVASYQERINSIGKGPGYGFLRSMDDQDHLKSWGDVIMRMITTIASTLAGKGLIEDRYTGLLLGRMDDYQTYFDSIEPYPFFDDLTTKNILIHDGRISGIVDLDEICFGDRLLNPALTRMSLLANDLNIDYYGYLLEFMGVKEHEREVLDYYTLIFCADFLAEIDTLDSIQEREKAEKLNQLFNRLVQEGS